MRGLRGHLVLASGLVLCVLLAAPGSANGPEIGLVAGTVVPLESADVQLVREDVTVEVNPFSSKPRVTAVYVLRNLRDRSRHLAMGFIHSEGLPRELRAGPANRPRGLSVRRDDRDSLSVRMVPVRARDWEPVVTHPPDSIPAWDVQLDPHGHAALWIEYEGDWSGGSDGETAGVAYDYCARPARLWAGSIERARIQFVIGEPASRLIRVQRPDSIYVRLTASPDGYRWDHRGLVWEFTDWEPNSDFRISFDYPLDQP